MHSIPFSEENQTPHSHWSIAHSLVFLDSLKIYLYSNLNLELRIF